jgi:glyoxylase-like metal-dependent hydrolase (beta-lactamase superfamily II)
MEHPLKLAVTLVPVTAFQQNCAILHDPASRRGAIVDPGGDVPRILAAIEKCGVTIESILLTHGHLDHAGGASALARALVAARPGQTVPILGPEARDRFLLEGIARQAAAFGLADMEDVTPDRFLAEGDEVEIAGVPFAVLHCPGHTPGHIVFVDRANHFAVLGDVLFQGSIGRTDFPYGDQRQLLAAIAGKILPLGDDVQFICGHGPGSSIGAERRHNPFLRGL